MKRSHPCHIRAQRGVGLIEVLVAMFVIAVGLLGVAKMQAVAIADSAISSRRAIAAMQAASLASAMHANTAYWAAGGTAPALVTITGTTISDTVLSSQSALCDSSSATACSPLQMAALDLRVWASQISTLLPTGEKTEIRCSQATNVPVTCTIAISWTENLVTLNNNDSKNGTQTAPQYTLYVEP